MHKAISTLAAVALMVSPALAAASVDISLYGANPQTVRAGTVYSDPGYSAFSTVDGDLTSLVSFSAVDTNHAGWTSRSYSVSDSMGDTASASRSIFVAAAGGTMPYCSGPMAPGWNVSLPGGGCGGAGIVIPAGHSAMIHGNLAECPFWYPSGCLVE